jgi:hypothetical protein
MTHATNLDALFLNRSAETVYHLCSSPITLIERKNNPVLLYSLFTTGTFQEYATAPPHQQRKD